MGDVAFKWRCCCLDEDQFNRVDDAEKGGGKERHWN